MTNDQQSPEIPQQNTPEDAADWLQNAPRPQLASTKKAEIHARMMAHVRQQDFDPKPLRPNFTAIIRWAVIASLVLVVMSTVGVSATFASVPGEVLYPIKQQFEQLEFRFASTAPARATLHLTQAQRRVDEVGILLQRDQIAIDTAYAALDHMAHAATIARTDTTLSEVDRNTIQVQTTSITSQLHTLLTDDATDQLLESVLATENSGALLLPATSTPTATPTSTTPPTETAIPSSTPTTTVTSTNTPTPTITPSPTLLVSVFTEGHVEEISGNIVMIYGIDHPIDPNNPLLDTIGIGDYVRIVGDDLELIITETPIINITAPDPINTVGDTPNSQQNTTGWQDNGSCNNPPPDHAPAHGWRARCEDQVGPDNSGNQGQNNGNSGNNNGNGQGNNGNRGRGNNDDDDDD